MCRVVSLEVQVSPLSLSTEIAFAVHSVLNALRYVLMFSPKSSYLLASLFTYTAATTLHFIHNAIYLSSYPNMPAWISEVTVFRTLTLILSIGVVGCFISLTKYRTLGLVVIAFYASFGFDGLGHYALAPISQHTLAMNFTILFEEVRYKVRTCIEFNNI